MNQDDIKKNILNALTFLSQAQDAAPEQSDLWKEIGKVWDDVDTLHDMVAMNEYSSEGKYVA